MKRRRGDKYEYTVMPRNIEITMDDPLLGGNDAPRKGDEVHMYGQTFTITWTQGRKMGLAYSSKS